MYLIGGGNSTYCFTTKKSICTPLFCKEVYVLDKSIGNHKNKVWISSDKGESLARKKVLTETLEEAFDRLKFKIDRGAPLNKIGFLIEYISENYPHKLL